MKTKKIMVMDLECHIFSETAIEKPYIKGSVFDFLKSKYQKGSFFGLDNLQQYGHYKLLGWKFDFKPYLKKFYYKQYGYLGEAFAPTKTDLIKSIYGKVSGVVEVKK